MKKNKIISLVVCLVMLCSALGLVACGQNGGETASKRETLLLWGPSAAQTFLKEKADAWAKDYKDAAGKQYKVIMGVMGEGDAGTSLLNAPEDGADVFAFADDQLAKLNAAKVLSAVGDPTKGTAKEIAERNSNGSVTAATGADGKLYAYPVSADNAYFLYYDSSVLTEEDVKTWDGIWAKASAQKKVQFKLDDAWYQAAFFFSFGGTVSEKATNFDSPEVGHKALQAIYEFSKQGEKFLQSPPEDGLVPGLNDKSVIAGVAGNWIYDSITNKDVKLAILPKIKLGNETVDMKSFLGCKLMGVNSTTKYQEASHALANYLTSEAVQTERITKLKTGPSNIKAAESQAAKALPTAQIIAQQAANSVPQINLPAGFWDAVKTTCDAVNAKLHAGDKTYFTEEGTPVTAKLDELLVAMKTAFKLKV